MDIKEKLKALGLALPEPSKPGGNYMPVCIRRNTAYIAVQFPKSGAEMLFKGRIGDDLSTEDGYQAMQLCALNVLAHIENSIGFEKVLGINHLEITYQAAEGWDEAPKVADGASDLLVSVLGDKGMHSRNIFGVERLPRNFSVGLTCSLTIAD